MEILLTAMNTKVYIGSASPQAWVKMFLEGGGG